MERFLISKCIICYTPGQEPSRKLPCCSKKIHESCLQKCFHYQTKMMPRCPHCRQQLYPINRGQAPPTVILEGSFVFQFEFQNFAPQSLSERADERWDFIPFLVPPPGWTEFRRRHVTH